MAESGIATTLTGQVPVAFKVDEEGSIRAEVSSNVYTAPDSMLPVEVMETEAGLVSLMGPQVQREVSVHTDLSVEATPPSPTLDKGGAHFTMKKTLKTTTREVVTSTRQEIKTELQVSDSTDNSKRFCSF